MRTAAAAAAVLLAGAGLGGVAAQAKPQPSYSPQREVVAQTTVVPAGTRQVIITPCPAGKGATGGGWDFDGPTSAATRVTADSPWPTGWLVETVTGEVPETLHTYVVCIAE